MCYECLHKNIKIISVSCYNIEIGWDSLREQEDINMEDYLIEIKRDRISCDDCAKTLDE